MNYMKFFQEQFWHFVSRPKITILTNEYLGVVNAKSATETNFKQISISRISIVKYYLLYI